MSHFSSRWMLVSLIIAGLTIVACGVSANTTTGVKPSKVEEMSGSEFARITLTQRAVERLNLQTAQVGDMTVPYASVIYGNHGETWVYTNSEPLTYTRENIEIDHIQGEIAYLLKGPPAGVVVVTAGAAELWGSEFGVGK